MLPESPVNSITGNMFLFDVLPLAFGSSVIGFHVGFKLKGMELCATSSLLFTLLLKGTYHIRTKIVNQMSGFGACTCY